jgi:hypothetical protein
MIRNLNSSVILILLLHGTALTGSGDENLDIFGELLFCLSQGRSIKNSLPFSFVF